MQVALLQPFPPHDIVSPLLSLHCQHFLPVTPICHQNYHFQLQINSRTSSEGLGWTQCPPKEGSWPLDRSPNQFSGLQLHQNFLPAWAPSQSLRLSAQPDDVSVFKKETSTIFYHLLLGFAHFKPAPTPFAQGADKVDVMITVVTFK